MSEIPKDIMATAREIMERIAVTHPWKSLAERDIAEALLAERTRALSQLEAGAVKPLEWFEHPGSFPAPEWSAQTPFGFYNIEEISASDSPAYEVRLHAHRLVAVVDGLSEAKAAAQADYSQRILSALASPSPAPEAEPVAVRLIKRMDSKLDDLSPEEFVGVSNGCGAWVELASVAEIRNAARPMAGVLTPEVRVKTMRLSDGRSDYFVSIKVGDREVHPHVFRQEFKAAYHVALYEWLLNDGDNPDLMAFDEGDWPAQATVHATPTPAVNADAVIEAERKFKLGDPVHKSSGSWWEGKVVGFYSTEQTPIGYCVQLLRSNGPVQIYPETALALSLPPSADKGE